MTQYFIALNVNGHIRYKKQYLGYTKREAIRRFREEFDLKYKRVDLIVSRNFIS